MVRTDPDNLLSPEIRTKFHALLDEYEHVFDPQIQGYNGAAGTFEPKVNMGPVEPPQHKGRLPQYARAKVVELQQKFDELEQLGVFKHLVKKPSGGFRLVTAFADVVRYSKPQPSALKQPLRSPRAKCLVICWRKASW